MSQRHHYLDTVDQVLTQAVEQGVLHLQCDDRPIEGAAIWVQGRQMVSFGSCSYLGLEQDSRLIEGVIEAVRRHGTQFSSSRAYLSTGLYRQLEQQLEELFQAPVIVTPTTSLGHQAALPVLVRDEDAVILDHQVHASVQNAAQLLKPRGIPVHHIRHNRMDQLEDMIRQFRSKHRKIWYLADGIYSMYGDAAPLQELEALLARYEALHLYLDDAHGMSWAGKNGCGFVRSRMAPHPRVMLAVSLNKAFAAAGGALVFPNQEWARKVRICGPTLIFSGPIQPPMLGAAVASANLHLSGEITPLQVELQRRLDYARTCLTHHRLPFITDTESPIFFVATGLPRVAYNLIGKLNQEGFYVNSGTFPAAPMTRGGVRFTLTRHHDERQIDHLLQAMAHYYPLVLEEEGIAPETIEQSFEEQVKLGGFWNRTPEHRAKPENSLRLDITESIDKLCAKEWDRMFGANGSVCAEYLQLLERVFGAGNTTEPEHQWQFRYLTVRDEAGRMVLAAPMTRVLMKDDMFAPGEVSQQIEDQRSRDPYWLTSPMVLSGTPCGEGEALFINRSHPQWSQALALYSEEVRRYGEQVGASQILLRDFDEQVAQSLAPSLLDLGFVQVALPDRYGVSNLDWHSEAEYLARMSARYRYSIRKEALAFRDLYRVETCKAVSEEVMEWCYQLYRQVHANSLALNSFALPKSLFQAYFTSANSDVLRLYLKDGPEAPVAVMFSYFPGEVYTASFVGLDYRFLESHKVYKQILYRTVVRARELGASYLQLGFTAGLEKRKVGALKRPTYGFAMILDHYNLDIIESMSVASGKRSTG